MPLQRPRGGGQRTHSHYNQEAREKPSQVEHGGARALDKVIGVGAPAADPVGQRGNNVCGDYEEREVRLVQGAREDDEQEPDGEHEGEGDDGFEAGGRHG